MAGQIMVGMAEFHVAKDPAQFVCLGLGSCIGLLLYDATARVGGMAHIMLPAAFADRPVDQPAKFADTGVPALLEAVMKAGANRSRLVAAWSGGAQVFKFGSGSKLDVGARNGVAVAEAIKGLGIRVLGSDVGGSSGRTMTVDTTKGEIRVRTINAGEKVLCRLR